MPDVSIQFDKKDLKRTEKMLRGIPGGVQKVMGRTVSTTRTKLKTELKRAAMRHTYIKSTAAGKRIETRGRVVRTQTGASATITIIGHGRRTNWSDFQMKPNAIFKQQGRKVSRRPKVVQGFIFRSEGPRTHEGAFVINGRASGKRIAVYKTEGGGLETLYGPYMTTILEKTPALKESARFAQEFMKKELLRQTDLILEKEAKRG